MERKVIFERLNEIFQDILDDEEIVLTETMTAEDVEGWDSLSHIQLVVAIEKKFGVRFSSMEIIKWKNVGEMVDSIVDKVG